MPIPAKTPEAAWTLSRLNNFATIKQAPIQPAVEWLSPHFLLCVGEPFDALPVA